MDIFKNRDFTPMLLKEIDKPFNSKKYLFELKFDGIRSLIFVNNKNIKIQSRNQKDLTNIFPELKKIKNMVNKNVIFDGEIVSLNNGKPSFSNLQKRIHIKDKKKIFDLSNNEPVLFVAFDIIYENKDLTDKKLIERKKFLNKYKNSEVFFKIKTIDTYGEKLFNSVKKLGLEGIVAKLKDGLYHINKRTEDFIKIKNIKRDEFLIGGFEIKKNGILSLSIGEYINKNFCFVGKVSISKKASLYNKIKSQKKSQNYFTNFDEDIIYIKPILSCFVSYLERTKNNHLRHPIYNEI